MIRCALHNLGCKVNSYETQAMQKLLIDEGYEIVPFGDEIADVYIINTCSVTNIADRKSRQMIHKARKLNPEAVVVACGCYVESAGASGEVDEDIDLVIGNREKSHLIELLNAYFEDRQRKPDPEQGISSATDFDEMRIDEPEEHTRAYVKIQDGCNRFCTYCIIPYVRGRIRSRKPQEVVAEIERIAASGCREVVLTGIHLSSYGLDCPEEGVFLIDVIERINAIPGIRRIRLGSLEPRIITDEFVKRLSACEKVCPHFHLSLQSGCDSVLRRMNRQYTTAEYREGVEKLRSVYEQPAITTDVIVGFPQETEEEFACTVEYLRQIRFYELHVFKYSRRKGTMADAMPGQLTDREKSRRSDVLTELDEELSEDYRRELIGHRAEVLLEEERFIDGIRYMTGYTPTYVRVAVQDAEEKLVQNELVWVRITELRGRDLALGVAEI